MIDQEYKKLLDKLSSSKNLEKEIHEYLEKRPSLLPNVYNPAGNLVASQFPLSGAFKRVPDFLYCSQTSLGFQVYMIEIEAPHKKVFKPNSTEFTTEFSQAYHQLEDWRVWVKERANFEVLQKKLSILYDQAVEIHKVNYILIYGRRSELNNSNRKFRDGRTRGSFEVMSFDRLKHSLGDMIVVKPDKDTFKVAQVTDDYELCEPLHGHFSMGSMIDAIDNNEYMQQAQKEAMIREVEELWC